MSLKQIRRTRNPSKKHSEFMKWFGKSKVIDQYGEPLMVFHGTRSIEVFDVFKYGNFENNTNLKFSNDINSFLGPHFTESPEVASKIAVGDYSWTENKNSGYLIPVYLKIENPLIYDEDEESENLKSEEMLKEDIMSFGSGTKEEKKIINDYIFNLIDEDEDDEIDLLEMREEINNSVAERLNILGKSKERPKVMEAIARMARFMMKDQGYDGIFYRNGIEGGGMSFVPFSEKQIWWILKKETP